MLFQNPVLINMHLQRTTQPGFVAAEKMAGIFTKRIWQPYKRKTIKQCR